MCSCSGKGNSELGLLHKLWGVLRRGDVLLADRCMCAWYEIYMLGERGIDSITRMRAHRQVDFRRGKRLGKGDHIVQWKRPAIIRAIDTQTRNSLPEFLTVRETRVQVEQPGFRSQSIILVTTMLNRRRPRRNISRAMECRT